MIDCNRWFLIISILNYVYVYSEGEPSSSIIAQDQQQQEESAAAANYDHGDRSVLSNSIEAVEGESVLESPEDYCEASNQSLVNNANTVEEAGQSPMKRKVTCHTG